jgi:hypothetical protein
MWNVIFFCLNCDLIMLKWLWTIFFMNGNKLKVEKGFSKGENLCLAETFGWKQGEKFV